MNENPLILCVSDDFEERVKLQSALGEKLTKDIIIVNVDEYKQQMKILGVDDVLLDSDIFHPPEYTVLPVKEKPLVPYYRQFENKHRSKKSKKYHNM